MSESSTLYAECLEGLRRQRFALGDVLSSSSPSIDELSKQEKQIIKTLLKQAERSTQVRSKRGFRV